ncbi:MAG TPA: hypothetical protein PKK26_04095 [Candidatus Wallbacteria bacterium]|nr:hypothetical protein [Candidatus Wallbacteria bacterium]
MISKNRFYLFAAAFLASIFFYIKPAFACIICVDEMIWMFFPFYKWWLLILCLWAVLVFIDKARAGAGPFIFLRGVIITVVSLFLSIMLFFLYPFILLAIFGKWAGNYYRAFKNFKNNNTAIEDKNILPIYHFTMIIMLLTAAYFYAEWKITGPSYPLYHIYNGSSGIGYTFGAVKNPAITDEALLDMLKSSVLKAKVNSMCILLERKDIKNIEKVIDEIKKLPEPELPWKLSGSFNKAFGAKISSRDECEKWFEDYKKDPTISK